MYGSFVIKKEKKKRKRDTIFLKRLALNIFKLHYLQNKKIQT